LLLALTIAGCDASNTNGDAATTTTPSGTTSTTQALPSEAPDVDVEAVDDAGCDPIAGVSGLFEPNTAILVGELHGTVESPAFVDALTCTALSNGYSVVVGLEIPDDETAGVQQFLASDGGAEATAQVLAGRFWSSEFADGRQSTAMFELLDALRRRVDDGAAVDVVLLDASGVTDRDAAMADHLVDAFDARPDGVAITLTGNFHNRRTRRDDYEPMGYLVARTLGDGAVRALDVSYTGGAAWTCSQDQTCGPRSFDGNADSSEHQDGSFAVELFTRPTTDGFDGVYFVGELTPSAPASKSAHSAD
jgi:hypothetical protein